jgi:hypothetical protein
MPANIAEDIGEKAFQLAKLAKANKLDTLSHLLEMAALEAANIDERLKVRTLDRHPERKRGTGSSADSRLAV